MKAVSLLNKKRHGFVIMAGVVGMSILTGIFIYSGILSANWTETTRKEHYRIAAVMYKYNQHTRDKEQPTGFTKAIKNVMWNQYFTMNITSLRELVEFKISVKKMHDDHKKWVGRYCRAAIIGSGLEPIELGAYNKYVRLYVDRKSGLGWTIPIYSRIPPERALSGFSSNQDLSGYYNYEGTAKNKYPESLLSTRAEINTFYSDRYIDRSQLEKFKTNPLMPFSIY